MKDVGEMEQMEVWFVTGSQHLYGPEALAKVAMNSSTIATSLDSESALPVRVVWKPVLTTADEILNLCRDASRDSACVGLVLWMHTFSPAKMWIAGLTALTKPFLHLHTQFDRELPYSMIDMDFMNLNQAAHGDREFGFITARLRLARKVVVGFWKDAETVAEIGAWTGAALGWNESQNLKVARFGDNMRNVAVTEGDKVEAQKVFGFTVSGYGVGDLVDRMNQFTDKEVDRSSRSIAIPTPLTRSMTGQTRCRLRRRSNSACAHSSKRAASAPSRTPSRICTAWGNCLA
jgi:L-arabinose isomerase